MVKAVHSQTPRVFALKLTSLATSLALSLSAGLAQAKSYNVNVDAHAIATAASASQANSATTVASTPALIDNSSVTRIIRASQSTTLSPANSSSGSAISSNVSSNVSSNNGTHLLTQPTAQADAQIRQTLKQAGIKPAIISITPSDLPNMYEVMLQGQPALHITADGRYVLQGELQPNPSPQVATPPTQSASQTQAGMPVSNELRQAMMQNMSLLKNMKADTPLYHTAVPGVIWGMTFEGQPFITNAQASVFTDGEVSVIENGQFAGLDIEFEKNKNRHIFSQLDEKQLIVYPAKGKQKAVVYVATDTNCPYCRQFHSQIPKLNSQGVTVKVIGYPIYEESPEQMRQIWCESGVEARRRALDSAMKGQIVPTSCDGAQAKVNNLTANRTLASGLAVFATPAIFRDDGLLYQGSFEDPEFLEFLGIQSK